MNGVRTKLEKNIVQQMLSKFDIISLNEIKTPLAVSFPGYVSYISIDKNHSQRGGTCVFVKHYLSAYVLSVDTSITDQVWIQFRCFPGVLFGFCYVPPSDSPYFDRFLVSKIQEKVLSNECENRCILVGDLNARFGNSVHAMLNSLHVQQQLVERFSYSDIPDPVAVPTDNAAVLAGLCVNAQLLLLNNLDAANRHFSGNLTYRQGARWVSELDVCIVSPSLICSISDFVVNQDTSLPSDHAPISFALQPLSVNEESLLLRASRLGDHAALYSCGNRSDLTKKPIKYANVNKEGFLEALALYQRPEFEGNIDDFAVKVNDILYKCSATGRILNSNRNVDITMNRWERLLQEKDDAQVWRAINWRGEIDTLDNDSNMPTDQQFKEYFEEILNPPNVQECDLAEMETNVSMPVLDSPITAWEVSQQIKKLKPNKTCGPDGLAPGVMKFLPVTWIITISLLFNCIFVSRSYPVRWTLARLSAIFKRGCRSLVSNYRGISVINGLAKLYDMVLYERLQQWFAPFREQAGCQVGRGCIEHIVSLRLLTDLAKRKKWKLFVTFVDFSQAYDKVPRNMLFTVLKRIGCGATMLFALIAMYRVTHSVIGTAVVSAAIGVRQGSPTSCLLFILFVNDLINLIKQNCDIDGFLTWLHVLVLMDDTVLLATTRRNMIKKVELLNHFCETHGMIVNARKTKFFVIGGSEVDKEIIQVGGLEIESCERYVYLGSPFTSDGSISSAIKVHAQSRMCHALKFISFLSKNNDIPFLVKRKVFNAALLSTILYGCESWIGGDLKPIVKLYHMCLKQLLGVRKSTCNNLCLVELGYPPLKALVTSKQRKFFSRMWDERSNMIDDPLIHAMSITLSQNTPTSRHLNDLLNNDVDDIQVAIDEIKRTISESSSSRMHFYREINSNYNLHAIYTENTKVNEIERVSWTRMRLSAHSLAIESGRWNRRGRGRLPLEERLCSCGRIQSEKHVIEDCPRTVNLRNQYGYRTVQDLFGEMLDDEIVCSINHSILQEYL